MPRYDAVDDSPQLPNRRTRPAVAAPEPEAWVAITTTVPAAVRKEMTIACAVHGVKLKDAVTEALRAWLTDHPGRL